MKKNEKNIQRKKSILWLRQILEQIMRRKAPGKTTGEKCHGDEENQVTPDAGKKQILDTQEDERKDIARECIHHSGSENNTRLMHSSDDEPGYIDTS